MALALNTSHALYADLIALICVDDDDAIKDLKGDTCTPNASVVVGTGTYGRHFRTTIVANNALGVALTNGFLVKPVANPVGTTFVVINAGNSRASRGAVFNGLTSGAIGPGVYTGDVAGIQDGSTAYPTALGTTDIIGTGAHSFGCAYNGTTGQLAHKTFADGAVEFSGGTNKGNASDTYKASYIGGAATGGYGGFAADYVWVAHFRRYLSDAEISDLHASLGADNVFGLVEAADGGAVTHVTTGALTAGAATIDGTSAHIATHVTSGALVAGAATLDGTAAREGATTTHVTTGALVAGAATLDGTASHAASGSFVSDVLGNNTSSIWSSTAVVWEWREGTGIGVAPTSVTYGTGTTSSLGVLTCTGLPTGDGELLIATTDYTGVAYQRGTVA